ncbi:ZIP zinc/iron transport family protein [Aspergillus niger]|uniref:ZIP zinc/iron transport family protein n=2 Tax=Aspergillus niger TaxID=5061 RepID=A0A505ITX9_ASPNG|nr:ZIP zinc/iron transport family protein [Aspergillus niger]
MGNKVSNISSIPEEFLADDWEEHYARARNPFCGYNYCCCYICGFQYNDSWGMRPVSYRVRGNKSYPRHPNYKAVAQAEGIEEERLRHIEYVPNRWWMWQRMIIHREAKSTYKVSGTYLLEQESWKLCVPIMVKGKRVYVDPQVYCMGMKATPPADWVGCTVHARCWELLSHHALGRVAETDLPTVIAALRYRRRVVGSPCKRWEHKMFAEDPVRTKCVSSAVYGAMQGKRRNWLKRLYLSRRKKEEQIPLIVRKLPMEVLYMILDYLPSRTVARAERALGVRVSNSFWYFRIVNNFFEVRGLSVNKNAYKRLCLKLEEQIYGNEALRIRRYLFNCMDNILDTVNMLQQVNLIDGKAS